MTRDSENRRRQTDDDATDFDACRVGDEHEVAWFYVQPGEITLGFGSSLGPGQDEQENCERQSNGFSRCRGKSHQRSADRINRIAFRSSSSKDTAIASALRLSSTCGSGSS